MIKTILHSMQYYPKKWAITEHTLSSSYGDIIIYIHKGWIKYKITSPVAMKLSLRQKLKLHKAIKKWKEKKISMAVKESRKRTYTVGITPMDGISTARDRENRYFDVSAIRPLGSGGIVGDGLMPRRYEASEFNLTQPPF